jgi:pyridoxamine 5'-phosphate oxidase family protein
MPPDMSAFCNEELRYLRSERRPAPLATVGRDGIPHVAPVGWSYNHEQDTIDIGGDSLEQTRKYRPGPRPCVLDRPTKHGPAPSRR